MLRSFIHSLLFLCMFPSPQVSHQLRMCSINLSFDLMDHFASSTMLVNLSFFATLICPCLHPQHHYAACVKGHAVNCYHFHYFNYCVLRVTAVKFLPNHDHIFHKRSFRNLIQDIDQSELSTPQNTKNNRNTPSILGCKNHGFSLHCVDVPFAGK